MNAKKRALLRDLECWVGWPKGEQPTHWMPLPDEPTRSRP